MYDTTRRDGLPPVGEGLGDAIIGIIGALILLFVRFCIQEAMAYFSAGEPALSKELTRVMKDVEKDLREARKAVATLQKLHTKLKPRKVVAGMGNVSKLIYTEKAARQTDIFSRLPAEIQRMIWSYLVHQPDRMAFALTCKWNAQSQDQLKSDYNRIALKNPQKPHRLAILVRLSTWAPDGYRVCFECVRFCKRIGLGEWGGDTAMIDEQYAKGGRVTKDAIMRGPRCPRCKYITGVQQLNHKSTVKEYKALLRKQVGAVE